MKKKKWCNYYRISKNDDAKVVNSRYLIHFDNQRNDHQGVYHTLSILFYPGGGGGTGGGG